MPNQTLNTYTVNTPASYSVKITDAYQCEYKTPAKTVSSKAKPEATLTGCPQNAVAPPGFVLTAGPENLNYQWVKSLDELPGQTNITYTVTEPGNYRVRVTDQFGCSKLSNLCQVKKAKAPKRPGQSPIYDSDKNLLILNEEDQTDFEIFDIQGKTIMKGSYLGEAISLPRMKPGIYLVRYLLGWELSSLRFIVP